MQNDRHGIEREIVTVSQKSHVDDPGRLVVVGLQAVHCPSLRFSDRPAKPDRHGSSWLAPALLKKPRLVS